MLGVKKSKIANFPKRVLPKFRADSNHVRIENGRSKFASAGFAKRKQCAGVLLPCVEQDFEWT